MFGSAEAPPRAEQREAEPVAEPAQEGAPAPARDLTSLAIRARETYTRALQAQREGDWARYGEEIEALGALIEEMARQPQ
jgi:uncharacterized membrane protein (UPF0182 family)